MYGQYVVVVVSVCLFICLQLFMTVFSATWYFDKGFIYMYVYHITEFSKATSNSFLMIRLYLVTSVGSGRGCGYLKVTFAHCLFLVDSCSNFWIYTNIHMFFSCWFFCCYLWFMILLHIYFFIFTSFLCKCTHVYFSFFIYNRQARL